MTQLLAASGDGANSKGLTQHIADTIKEVGVLRQCELTECCQVSGKKVDNAQYYIQLHTLQIAMNLVAVKVIYTF